MWPFNGTLSAITNLSTRVNYGFTLINQRLDKIIMSQSDIDNAVTAVTALLTDMATDNASILTDLTDIQTKLANGTPVDTTALNNVIANVQGVQTNLDSAVTALNTAATS